MNIEQLMHDIVDQPAPPSGLKAEAIYSAGRRRRRRRTHRTYGGLLVATVLASAGVVGANAHNFNAEPVAPTSDSASAVDTDTSADASAGADAELDTDGDGSAGADVSADADVDASAGADADASADADVDASADVDADASVEATAPAVPELPELDCDEIAATVKAELAAHGLDAANTAQVSCQDGTVEVVVGGSATADWALASLTVQVALVEAATVEDVICAGDVTCERIAVGVFASATGEIALGRTDGLVIWIQADAQQSAGLPGDIDQVASAGKIRDLALALGEALPTP